MTLRSLDELREALRKERDPEGLAELVSELYEALDEYSMDVALRSWRRSPRRTVELTPGTSLGTC